MDKAIMRNNIYVLKVTGFENIGGAGARSEEKCHLSGTQYGDYTGGEFLCQKV